MMWSGFILGLLGSFHCAGMCGPLAMALPDAGGSNANFIFGRLMYNIGRAITYAILGFLSGLIGYGFYFAGIQQILSIALGIMILSSTIPALSGINRKWQQPLSNKLKRLLMPLLGHAAASNLLLFGLLNGLLPCGFVYMGIAGAMLTASAVEGAVFMFLFGAGTLPMMMMMSVSRRFLTPKFRLQINRYMPFITAVVGALLIVRGLNLDIPFISPDLSAIESNASGCCHK